MRRVACGIIAIFAASSVQAQTSSGTQEQAGVTFCQRIAKPLKLELNTELFGATPKNPAYVHTQYSFQAFMIGDSFPTSFGVEALDENSLSDYKRAAAMCEQTRKGGTCSLAGPTRFHIRTRYANVVESLAEGENAVVRIEGTTIICQDRPRSPVQN